MKVEGFKDTIDWYDQNAEKYATSAEKVLPAEHLKKFSEALPKGASVLDAGCGSGRDSRALQSMGLRVTGLDISKGLLEEARKSSEGIEFIEGDLRNIPLPDASRDGVWSHASLVHLETIDDVKKALAEFSRVLKPDGVLHIYVKAQTGDEKTAVVSDALSNHDRFFRYYTEEELQELTASAGFGDVKISRDADLHGRAEVSWIALFARKL